MNALKINIISYENVDRWILGKFAKNLKSELNALGLYCKISEKPDSSFDINHHIIFLGYQKIKTKIDTLMVTHIDSSHKMEVAKDLISHSDLGICMSRDTMNILAHSGISGQKLAFVNPAHDGLIEPKKIHLGITCKVGYDGRKNESYLKDLFENVSPQLFRISIMGAGWEALVEEGKEKGFDINYWNEFDLIQYRKLMPMLDYYLYFGFDEGSMGFVDALAAGVKTIVTPQGYHLDAKNGVTYPIENVQSFLKTLSIIEKDLRDRIQSVKNWTWYDYAIQHRDLWQELLNDRYAGMIEINSKSRSFGKILGVRFSMLKGSLRNLRAERISYLNMFRRIVASLYRKITRLCSSNAKYK